MKSSKLLVVRQDPGTLPVLSFPNINSADFNQPAATPKLVAATTPLVIAVQVVPYGEPLITLAAVPVELNMLLSKVNNI